MVYHEKLVKTDAIIPCSTDMVLLTRNGLVRFCFYSILVFNIGHEIIIANSNPTRDREIRVNYFHDVEG